MEFNDAVVQQVWERGLASKDQDPSMWREDACGAWIQRQQLNNANSEFGWHIRNIQSGGEDQADNLHPLHVENEYNLMAQTLECHTTADRSHAKSGKPKNRSV